MQVLSSKARFIVLMCGRRWGKSLISQVITIAHCIKGKNIAYVTPTYLLAGVFFNEIIKLLPKGMYKENRGNLSIDFITGGRIRFFTGTRLDSFRGLKFHTIIIDEASFIPDLENGWLNSLRPTLTDYKGNAIFLSTPRGTNFFYSLYLKGKTDDEWESFKYSTYDNPNIDPTEIDSAKASLPTAVFEQEYMANPMENAANPFGSENIKSCIKPLSILEAVCYGIDLAKSFDYTVIVGLDAGGNVCYLDRFQKDWHTTKQAITKLPRKPILLDSTGVGDPIFEELQRHGLMVDGFRFTSNSKQQLMIGLQNAIHSKTIGYPEGVIVDELDVFEYQFTSTGVRYSAPSGFHDDCVMALALAYQNYTLRMGSGKYSLL
jgi:hypothetical protein